MHLNSLIMDNLLKTDSETCVKIVGFIYCFVLPKRYIAYIREKKLFNSPKKKDVIVGRISYKKLIGNYFQQVRRKSLIRDFWFDRSNS